MIDLTDFCTSGIESIALATLGPNKPGQVSPMSAFGVWGKADILTKASKVRLVLSD